MFENFDESQRWLVYSALVYAVRSNWGKGFHKLDQGHPAYRLGCDGAVAHWVRGDSPEHNTLYKMMLELSELLKEYPDMRSEDLVFSWEDFCKMATAAYDTHK